MFKNRLIDSYITQEGVSLGLIFGVPVYTDTADEENFYIGYCRIDKDLNKDSNTLICKIHVNGNETIKYFAYGDWTHRTSLEYK